MLSINLASLARNSRLLARPALYFAGFFCGLSLWAQTASTGALEGRVLNATNGDYLDKAAVTVAGSNAVVLTDSFGQYRVPNLPAGPVKVTISFTGLAPQTDTLVIPAGGTATHDVTLSALGRKAAKEGETVVLDQFVVQSNREMNGAAIAINEQRFKPNVSTVVSADEFGDNTDGNPGELMKFLPGVTADTNGSGEPRVISLAGAPVSATPILIDGFRLANASGGSPDRQTVFDQVTLNNMSRIEVNKSQTPDSPADAIGGTVNMISRSAFESSRMHLEARAYVDSRDGSGTLKHTAGPGEGPSVKIRPGYDFKLTVPVNKKFGYTLTGVHNVKWGPQDYESMNWFPNGNPPPGGTYAPPASNPYMYRYNPMIGQGFTTRDSVGATIDYKLSKYDVVSFSFNYAAFKLTFNNRAVNYSVGSVVDATSYGPTFTHGAPGKGSVSLNGGQSWAFRENMGTTWMPTVKFRHNGPVWQMEAGAGYSHSGNHYRDIDKGFFQGMEVNITGLTMNFDGIGPENVQQLTAFDSKGNPVDLSNLNNYTIRTASSNPSDQTAVFRSANVNLKRDWDLGRVPVSFKIGSDVRQDVRDFRSDIGNGPGNVSYTFVGADGKAGTADDNAGILLDPTFANRTVFGSPAFPWPSDYKLAQLFRAHPEYFTPDLVGAYKNNVSNSKHITETISSGYVRGDVHLFSNRLWLIAGVRYERTVDDGEGRLQDPTRMYQHDAAGNLLRDAAGKPILITTDTLQQTKLAYVFRGQHGHKSYDGYYPSLNAIINVTPNLLLRAAVGRTLNRPNYGNIIPGVTLPDPSGSSTTISVNNPALKPWTSTNYNAAFEYYFDNSAGLLSASVFRRDIKGFFISNTHVATAEDFALYDLDPNLYANYNISTTINGPAARTSGFEYSYKQNLTFLPSWARGFSVFHNGTIQRLTGPASGPGPAIGNSTPFTNFVPKVFNTGFSFARNRFTFKAAWSYRARERQTIMNANAGGEISFNYNTPRNFVDLAFDYRLNRWFSLFGAIRNITNQREDLERKAPDTPSYARIYARPAFKPLYTMGVKASF